MKLRWAIYISAAFVVAFLVLKNPRPYQLAADRLTSWFAKSFGSFGRVNR